MFPEDTRSRIESELMRARAVRDQDGHPGKVRVCCRRAAGEALGVLMRHASYAMLGPHALSRLDRISELPHIPAAVRAAAHRLRSRLNEDGGRDVSERPLEDVAVVLQWAEAEDARLASEGGRAPDT